MVVESSGENVRGCFVVISPLNSAYENDSKLGTASIKYGVNQHCWFYLPKEREESQTFSQNM